VSEHDEQVALFQWAKLNEDRYPELALMYANPLGGKRPRRTAARMKAEGARAGVPDITLPVARCGFHGMYIEMKFGKGRLTPAQDWWLDQLIEQNYNCVVCYGFEDARQQIVNYLECGKEVQP